MTNVLRILGALTVLSIVFAPLARSESEDPLPSWADGPVKASILAFVSDVTKEGGSKFVPAEERIAVFDNDGTLWCEQPVVQIAFLMHELKKHEADHPEWKTTQPFKAALEGDMAYLEKDLHGDKKGLMQLFAATHFGMSQKDFEAAVASFFATAKHPKYDRPFTELTYQPMLELLAYLRANGFETWICSGGGIYFMRVITEEIYGIPPQQVIGSHAKTVFSVVDGVSTFAREAGNVVVNDRAGKPVGIDLHIGRQPIFAAGNVRSGGDIEMLTHCQGSPHASLQLLVNHDDAEREYAYAEKDGASLKAAEANGWQVVSMKQDWARVFPPADERR